MKAIGGYFEIEDRGIGIFPHNSGILLNTGRNALEYILRSISNIKQIYLPYYTCEVVLEPIKKLSIPYYFYHINERLEIKEQICLADDEYIIVNNYFGIKDSYINTLQKIYGKRLIVDCAQAFFAPILLNTKMFYSTRKFVGVPDGGIAYGCDKINSEIYDIDNSSDRLEHLYVRKEKGAEAGFKIYQSNECKLDNQPIRRMSQSTYDILNHIDYDKIIKQRRKNYDYLDKVLSLSNQLQLPSLDSFKCPMVYPYLNDGKKDLRQTLISNKIFVARYWPNVLEWTMNDSTEYNLAMNLLPLPIDQRYDEKDMQRIIDIILEN